MNFDSIEACAAHIRNCMSNASSQMANQTMIEGRNIVNSQLKGYSAGKSRYKFPFQGSTGMTAASVTVTGSSANHMSVEMLDRGGWYSVITGQHFWALEGLESGSTWGRGRTTIMSTWDQWAGANLDRLFLMYMKAQGVPIG